ncbi:MAG: hypothetical protein HQL20_00680 [Candidatus Omnitrophica bacterium]|nr:hypothetical protein [Candidatus Omnitrophota bacterium]
MKATGLIDIRGPVEIPGDWWWLLLTAVGVLLLGLVWLLVKFLARKAARPAFVPPPIPPWEKALAEIALLAGQNPAGIEQIKQFYFSLSDIIRQYIEARFCIRAPEMTTEEFMERVRYAPELSAIQQEFLNNFLQVCDMVKFARFEPSGRDRSDALLAARRFVEGTRPVLLEVPPTSTLSGGKA